MSIPREGVRSVLYSVPDIEAAKRFWANLLGVAPVFEREDYFVEFQVGDTALDLAKSDEFHGRSSTGWCRTWLRRWRLR